MPDEKRTDSEEKRKETSGRPLTEEEWIELMKKHDSFDQYAKKRKKEQIEKRRQERKAEKDETDDE